VTATQERAEPLAAVRPGAGARVASAGYKYGLLVVLAAAILYFSLTQSAFATYSNLLIILESVVFVLIIGIGVTASMAVGGFDLSVGSIVDFVVMVTALAMVQFNLTGLTAIVAGLGAGLLVAGVNVLLIVVARIPDLVATLGSMFLFQGLALIITAGQSVSTGMTIGTRPAPGKYTTDFLWLGSGTVFSVPAPVIIVAVLAVAAYVLLDHTRWGRSLYAIGGNPVAARLAGIRVNRYRALAYVIAGLCAAVGAILLSARLGRGDVSVGDPYLLESVAAALTGFAVLGANRPNVLGTVIGSVFIGVILDGLTMMNAPYYTQDFVEGILLVIALVMSFTLGPARRRLRHPHRAPPALRPPYRPVGPLVPYLDISG
jgi:simple sugar transport system permease protein